MSDNTPTPEVAPENIIKIDDDRFIKFEDMRVTHPENENDVLTFKVATLVCKTIKGVSDQFTSENIIELINAGIARNMRARANAALADLEVDSGKRDEKGEPIMVPSKDKVAIFEERRKQWQESNILVDVETAKAFRPGERAATTNSLFEKAKKLFKEGKVQDAQQILNRIMASAQAANTTV